MSQELSTVIVFVPFVIIAAAVIILALFWVYDRIRPLIDNFAVAKSAASGEDSDASDEHDDGREKFPRSPLRSAADWFRHLADRRRNDPDDGEEDLDDSTATLLSMLPTASMVVNREDEVIRANPAAYTLGVVDDERIVSAEVREAIRQGGGGGGAGRAAVGLFVRGVGAGRRVRRPPSLRPHHQHPGALCRRGGQGPERRRSRRGVWRGAPELAEDHGRAHRRSIRGGADR